MPALKAAIFTAVKASGDLGISSVELLAEAYSDKPPPQREAIKAHISQINELLEETRFRIVSIDRRWVLTKVA
jgi:hypothetical protein